MILTKYKTAGEIAAKAMRTLVDAAQEGKTVLELMQLGDEAVEQGTAAVFKDKKMSKGLAFPTTVSITMWCATMRLFPVMKRPRRS